VAVILALVLGACSGGSSTSTAPLAGPAPIRIASFDFPESVLLAEVYGEALRARGLPVTLSLDLGSREIVQPALQQGFVDLVPEYAGSALDFVTVGRQHATADPVATHDLLVRALRPRGVAVLAASAAQDQNAVAVTSTTALENHIRSISDLAPVAGGLRFGGPPECPQRPLCLIGLQQTYGLHFGEFVALDASGPYTVNALKDGGVDVALLFTSDGAIPANEFVVLRDDRGLQPAENVTPVLRQAVIDAYGPDVIDVLDAVSAALTTTGLIRMNERVLDGEHPGAVAREWLERHGLVG